MLFERELSDDDYEEILKDKGSDKNIDSEFDLLKLESNENKTEVIYVDLGVNGLIEKFEQ